MAGNAQMKRFKPDVEQKCVHRRRNGAEVAHKLNFCFCQICRVAETLCVNDAVIRLVRFAEFGELAVLPIKASAVNHNAAHARCVTVHIFCGGMNHDVRAEIKRAAKYGRCKRVVHNKRNAVFMRYFRVFFYVKDFERGVGYGLAENKARVIVYKAVNLFFAHFGGAEADFDTHFFQRYGEQVDRAAVNRGRCNNVLSRAGDVQYRKKVGGLSRRSQNRTDTAFKRRYFLFHGVKRRVGKTGIEKALFFQIEKVADIRGGIIFVSCALNNGKNTRFAALRLVTALHALSFYLVIRHNIPLKTINIHIILHSVSPFVKTVTYFYAKCSQKSGNLLIERVKYGIMKFIKIQRPRRIYEKNSFLSEIIQKGMYSGTAVQTS